MPGTGIEIGADTAREVVLAVARGAGPVRLDGPARERIAAAHRAIVEFASTRPVYGRSTAVGANLAVLRSADPAAAASADRALLASHAATAGRPLSVQEVRAGIAVRLCQLAQGNSGISVTGADAFATLLDGRTLPPIGEFHAVGTGDLGALATLANALGPGALAPGDALPLMSSGAFTIGRALLVLADLEQWSVAAERVAPITLLAARGAASAWRPDAVGPAAGARRVAARLTAALAGQLPEPARLQDPFGLRTAPQTLGVLDDAVARLRATVDALLHSGPENPRVIAEPPQAVHNGAFHAVQLAADLDAATAGLARAAGGSGHRVAMLMGSAGQADGPPFLADKPGGSGLMALEYVAASALAGVRAAAFPVAVQQIHVGNQVETDAGFAPQAVTQLGRAVDAGFVVLAAELVAAVRGLRRSWAGPPWPAALDRSWLTLPDDVADRDLTGDLAAAVGLIRQAGPDPS